MARTEEMSVSSSSKSSIGRTAGRSPVTTSQSSS